MFCRTYTFTINGLDAQKVTIECDAKNGLFRVGIVGLPSNSIKESIDRVLSALKNSKLFFPRKKYLINLAPADIHKEGVGFDLPIAVAVLLGSDKYKFPKIENYALAGELSLDGSLRPVRGVLPMAIAAWKNNFSGLIIPQENAKEAAVVSGIKVIAVRNLDDVVSFLDGSNSIEPFSVDKNEIFRDSKNHDLDMADVKGQYQVKRALEISAAGGHNILMIGPPGSGKTMLARRLPTILPELTLEEALETTKIHSISGNVKLKCGIIGYRPFRSPHHTISDTALVGGGSFPKPGEVSLSHNGVLFLDELPEFKKSVLEVLRQPLEDGCVTISRANHSFTFPAEFMLVASMNPCPCGYYDSEIDGHSCGCSASQVQKYRSKISGPLLDRIDIHIEVPPVTFGELAEIPQSENSEIIRGRVNNSRLIQLERFQADKIYNNSQMNTKQLKKFCKLSSESKQILKLAIEKKGLSARAYDRIIKLSRTIADLDGSRDISPIHISEAVQYRSLDKKFWD